MKFRQIQFVFPTEFVIPNCFGDFSPLPLHFKWEKCFHNPIFFGNWESCLFHCHFSQGTETRREKMSHPKIPEEKKSQFCAHGSFSSIPVWRILCHRELEKSWKSPGWVMDFYNLLEVLNFVGISGKGLRIPAVRDIHVLITEKSCAPSLWQLHPIARKFLFLPRNPPWG